MVAVTTWRDIPGERTQGAIQKDWRQFVAEGEITAYVGDMLAAVAAETRRAAREAAALIEVEYEVLEPVVDPFDALAPDAPRLHPGATCCHGRTSSAATPTRRSARPPMWSTETFRTQFIEHAFLEPESGLAVPEAERRARRTSTRRARGCGRTATDRFLAGAARERVRVTQVSSAGRSAPRRT